MEIPFNFNPHLYEQLVILHNTIRKYEQDAVIIIVGEPGAGKSWIASQMAEVSNILYGRKGTDIEELFFEGDKYEEYARNNKLKTLVMDESYNTLNSKRTTSKKNFKFGGMLREVRSKGHTHIFLMQDLWDFEKFVVFQRADFMIYTYKKYDKKHKVLVPGYYKIYSRPLIRKIYVRGKDYHNMNVTPYNDGWGRATPSFRFDKDKYNNKKNAYIEKTKDKEEEEHPYIQKNKLLKKQIAEMAVNFKIVPKVSNFLDVTNRTLYNWLKYEEEEN